MIQTYKWPNMPKSFKRPYITIDGDIVALRYTIYGVTNQHNFKSVKAAQQYARANDIDNLPDAEFYN
ncbi:hypothetical protein L963_1345 [Leuconostoc mesenteroides subsp. cremoris T26]|nr:hypothetical protein L963_1345 [Leuconostoc mesenteroides subsp. cremoris T26]